MPAPLYGRIQEIIEEGLPTEDELKSEIKRELRSLCREDNRDEF